MSMSFVLIQKGNTAITRRKESEFEEKFDDMEEWRKELGRTL